MPGRKGETEITYSSVQEFIGPDAELDVIQPEDKKLKRRLDAIFDFCVFFASPALAVVLVSIKPHRGGGRGSGEETIVLIYAMLKARL